MKISVCIATYNGEKYIREQLTSILSQIDENDEVIVSDDSSTDDTIKIIKELNNPQIKIFEGQTFRNHIQNFSYALSKASGDIVFVSDQDDVWHPDRVKEVKEKLKDYDLVICNCFYVDKELNILKSSWFENINAGKGFFKNFHKNTYLGCCLAFNKKVLKAVVPIPPAINSHDTWIGLMAELVGKTYFLDKQLHYFRRHGHNFSSNVGQDTMMTQKSPYTASTILKNRFVLLYNLVFRVLKVKF